MPKKYDEAELLRVFDETNNGRETARRLGIHRNTAVVALRRLRGRCPRCGKKKAPNRRECPTCLVASAARMKERRKARARLGLCVVCDEPMCARSRQFCERHKQEDIDYRRRREEQRRQGQPNGGRSTDKEHASKVLYSFGQAGVDRWKADEGRCQVCDRGNTTIAIHLHHIDQNPKNNTFDNLACLCFDCHQAVHKLMRTPVRAFLAWFDEKYPQQLT